MAEGRLRALLIEDNLGDARLIREQLRDANVRSVALDLEHVERLQAGLERLEAGGIDVVLLDLTLPDSQGLETFEKVRARVPSIPVVVLSGLDDEAVAVHAVQAGAQDYLVKGHVEGSTLLRSVLYAVERARLEETRRELEQQKNDFFSSVSHDLRTPVAAIKTSIGVVLAHEPAGISPALHRLLENVDLAADELGQLVDDLLEIARLQAGRVELWRTDGDLRAVVQRCVAQAEPLAQAQQQTIHVSLPAEPVVLRLDAERVGRAILNLLGNATKYGQSGGAIWVRLTTQRDGVVLEVADDGPGIDPGEQEKIFDRYYRAPGARGQVGSGLGLPIARSLVELHEGRVWVESTPGAGSHFYVALPWEASHEPESVPAAPAQ